MWPLRLWTGAELPARRLSTAGLLVVLCVLYPDWYLAALLTLMLDIGSHWAHMYATLLGGASTHKVRRCCRL